MLDKTFILAYIISPEIQSVKVINGVLIESVAVHEEIFLKESEGVYKEVIDTKERRRRKRAVKCQDLRRVEFKGIVRSNNKGHKIFIILLLLLFYKGRFRVFVKGKQDKLTLSLLRTLRRLREPDLELAQIDFVL